MKKIGTPKITFVIQQAAEAVVARLKKGVVALILKDTAPAPGLYTVCSEEDIPSGMTETNKVYIKQALIGARGSRPRRVILSVIGAEGDVVTGAKALATCDADYIAGPPDMATLDAGKLKTWLTEARKGYFIGKLVESGTAANDMAVINFTAKNIKVGENTYTGAGYCARIAGILASTALSASATHVPLPEVESVDAVADPDGAIEKGELILVHDGLKAKLSRAVNSMTTAPEGVPENLRKIKLVEGLDLIRSYSMRLIEDQYIGQMPNNYDTKLLIVSTLQSFLLRLETEGVLSPGSSRAAIDLDAQTAYLQDVGVDVSSMTEAEILAADTGSVVFLTLGGLMQDSMEDFHVEFVVGGAR